jgi:hypothetical protein
MTAAKKGNKEFGFLVLFLLFYLFIAGFLSEVRADWSVPLNVTLNGTAQLALAFGKNLGATDNYDAGIDQLAPPQTPDGDTYYFRSITGQPTPMNNLRDDYRSNDNSQATWRLALTAADTKTFIVSWNPASLPAGWSLTWQEANSSWLGNGAIHNFSDASPQIEYTNSSGDPATKRYLIVAMLSSNFAIFLPLIIRS